MSKIMGFSYPPDGLTPEEKQIEKLIGHNSVDSLYAKLPTNRMKAIVALHFELGYPQELVAAIFGVDQSRIAQEITTIKKIFLGKSYKPHKRKPRAIPVEEVMRIFLLLLED